MRNNRLNHLRICLFGSYFSSYVRNRVIRDGLARNGVTVVEVHREQQRFRLESKSDYVFSSFIRRIIWSVRDSLYFLSQFINVMSCDVILVLYPGHLSLVSAKLVSIFTRKPLVFDAFTSLYDAAVYDRETVDRGSLQARLLHAFEKLLLLFADRLLVDTEEMKQFIHSEYGFSKNYIFVVPVGADSRFYRPATETRKKIKNVVLFFGGYNPLQGAEYIVRAAQYLKDRNIVFKMIGDGWIKQRVVSFVKHNRLQNVMFLGKLQERELVREIRDSDIMLGIFSNNQTARRVVPSKVYAGLACRKPVITARHPAVARLFAHKKHVFFCRPADPKSLSRAIRYLVGHRKQAATIASEGHKLYQVEFSDKAIGRELVRDFNSIFV